MLYSVYVSQERFGAWYDYCWGRARSLPRMRTVVERPDTPAGADTARITHRPASALPERETASARRKLSRGRLARDRYLLWTQVVNLLCRWLGSDRLSGRLRIALLRRYGWQIGPGTQIDGLRYGYGLVRIGADVYINRDCYLEGEAPITIGD